MLDVFIKQRPRLLCNNINTESYVIDLLFHNLPGIESAHGFMLGFPEMACELLHVAVYTVKQIPANVYHDALLAFLAGSHGRAILKGSKLIG